MATASSLASTVNFGQTWGTPGGQDLSSPSYMASGVQAVSEAIARRWSTTQGRLVDDPSYGRNITDRISDDMSPADIQYEQQQLAAEAEKDPRVLSITVTIKLAVDGTLSVRGSGQSAYGPFSLVLPVGQVTPGTLLAQQT